MGHGELSEEAAGFAGPWWMFPPLRNALLAGALAGIAFAAVLALPMSAGATPIFRWVDDQGQVHYGDRPPPGVAADSIPPPLPPGTGEAQRQLQDYVRTLEAQDAERASEAEQRRQNEQREAARKAECQSSREQRARLENPRQREYSPDGRARRLTEEERQARIQETEKRIADACT